MEFTGSSSLVLPGSYFIRDREGGYESRLYQGGDDGHRRALSPRPRGPDLGREWLESETAPVKGVAEEVQVEAREILRGLGAPDDYITGLVTEYSKLGSRVYSSEDAITEINKRWGNEAAARLDDALLVIDEGGPDLAKFMNRHPEIGNSPDVISWLSERGREIREARAAIEAIQEDETHPYHNTGHPRHAKALKEMETLFQTGYPGGTRQ